MPETGLTVCVQVREAGGDDSAEEPDHLQLAAGLAVGVDRVLRRQGLVQLGPAAARTPHSCAGR